MGGGSSVEQVPIVVTPARPERPAVNNVVSPAGNATPNNNQSASRSLLSSSMRAVDTIPVWEYKLKSDDDETEPWTQFSSSDHERLETTHGAFAGRGAQSGPPSASASPSSSASSVVVLLGRTAWNVHLGQPPQRDLNSATGAIFPMTRGSGHNGLVRRRLMEKSDLNAPSPFDDPQQAQQHQHHGQHQQQHGRGLFGEVDHTSSSSLQEGGCRIKLEATVKAHGSLVYCIDFSADGQRVLSGSKDGSLRYFELESSRVVCDYKPIDEVVLSCTLSPNGRYAVCGSSNANAYVFSTTRTKPRSDSTTYEDPLATLTGHKHKVYGVKFTHDSRTLVTGAMDCAVRTWDPARGFDCTRTIIAHTGPIFAVATSPMSSNLILSGGDDHLLVAHDMRDSRPATNFRGHKQTIWTCDIRCDERQFISASMEGLCLLWDARSNRRPLQVVADHQSFPVHCALFMPEGGTVLTSARDSTWRMWQIHPSLARNPHGTSNNTNSGENGECDNNNNNNNVRDAEDTTINGVNAKIEDVEALGPHELARAVATTGNVFKLAYDSIRNRVMSCGSDGLIKLWSLQF